MILKCFVSFLTLLQIKEYIRYYNTLIKIPDESVGEGFDVFVFNHNESLLQEYVINHIKHTGLFDTKKTNVSK